MKKPILLLISIALSSSLYALSWNPSTSAVIAYDGTKYSKSIDSSGTLRSSIGGMLTLDVAAISIDRHSVSLPMSLALCSESNTEGRTRVQQRMTTGISLEYGYAFSDIFTLSASIDAAYEYFPKAEGGRWLIGGTITPEFFIGRLFSMITELSAKFGKGSAGFSLGVGAKVHFL